MVTVVPASVALAIVAANGIGVVVCPPTVSVKVPAVTVPLTVSVETPEPLSATLSVTGTLMLAPICVGSPSRTRAAPLVTRVPMPPVATRLTAAVISAADVLVASSGCATPWKAAPLNSIV